MKQNCILIIFKYFCDKIGNITKLLCNLLSNIHNQKNFKEKFQSEYVLSRLMKS